MKAFSGSKIDHRDPQTGSGDERVNRLHEKTEKAIERDNRLCFLRGQKFFSFLSGSFNFT